MPSFDSGSHQSRDDSLTVRHGQWRPVSEREVMRCIDTLQQEATGIRAQDQAIEFLQASNHHPVVAEWIYSAFLKAIATESPAATFLASALEGVTNDHVVSDLVDLALNPNSSSNQVCALQALRGRWQLWERSALLRLRSQESNLSVKEAATDALSDDALRRSVGRGRVSNQQLWSILLSFSAISPSRVEASEGIARVVNIDLMARMEAKMMLESRSSRDLLKIWIRRECTAEEGDIVVARLVREHGVTGFGVFCRTASESARSWFKALPNLLTGRATVAEVVERVGSIRNDAERYQWFVGSWHSSIDALRLLLVSVLEEAAVESELQTLHCLALRLQAERYGVRSFNRLLRASSIGESPEVAVCVPDSVSFLEDTPGLLGGSRFEVALARSIATSPLPSAAEHLMFQAEVAFIVRDFGWGCRLLEFLSSADLSPRPAMISKVRHLVDFYQFSVDPEIRVQLGQISAKMGERYPFLW